MSIDAAYRNGMLQATENAEERYRELLVRFRAMEVERDASLSTVIKLERAQAAQPVSPHMSDGAQDNGVEFIPASGDEAGLPLRKGRRIP